MVKKDMAVVDRLARGWKSWCKFRPPALTNRCDPPGKPGHPRASDAAADEGTGSRAVTRARSKTAGTCRSRRRHPHLVDLRLRRPDADPAHEDAKTWPQGPHRAAREPAAARLHCLRPPALFATRPASRGPSDADYAGCRYRHGQPVRLCDDE